MYVRICDFVTNEQHAKNLKYFTIDNTIKYKNKGGKSFFVTLPLGNGPFTDFVLDL